MFVILGIFVYLCVWLSVRHTIIIVPEEAEVNILLTYTAFETFAMVLYKNNYTPVPGSTKFSFTDCDYSGYIAQGMSNPTVPLVDINGRAVTQWDTLTFAHNGGATPNNVYGYYIVNSGNGLVWAERFAAAPINMSTALDQIAIVPRFSFRSEF
jgi:hypothetical protein